MTAAVRCSGQVKLIDCNSSVACHYCMRQHCCCLSLCLGSRLVVMCLSHTYVRTQARTGLSGAMVCFAFKLQVVRRVGGVQLELKTNIDQHINTVYFWSCGSNSHLQLHDSSTMNAAQLGVLDSLNDLAGKLHEVRTCIVPALRRNVKPKGNKHWFVNVCWLCADKGHRGDCQGSNSAPE